MSDSVTRIIPQDPKFVPTPAAERLALSLLRAYLPDDQVTARRFDTIQFVDTGENFERVVCPYCRKEILPADWYAWLDRAVVAVSPPGAGARYAAGFADLTGRTPCCDRLSDLNSLAYEWPAGFARFMLEAMNPHIGEFIGGFLPDEVCASVANALGCPVRQICAYY